MSRLASPRKIDLIGPVVGLGVLTGLAIAVVFIDAAIRLRGTPADLPLATMIAVADDWQTLLGAVFTPLVAVVSVWIVLRQIQENAALETERLERRRRAQRSVMPIVMSRVCGYATTSGVRLREALVIAQREGVVVGSRVEPPAELDEASFDRITTMIEAARTDAEAAAYGDLLTELQVHAARWRGFSGRDGQQAERRFPNDVEDELVEAAELYARASNLLVHARPEGRAPGPPMTRRSGLVLIGMRDDEGRMAETASLRDTHWPLIYPGEPAPPLKGLSKLWARFRRSKAAARPDRPVDTSNDAPQADVIV